MPATEPLLTGDFMARLDRLDVISRKILAGKMRGERRSKRRGQSVEFADFRNYTIGDDLRFIDWNIYARLDRLFLKMFLEEEDLSVHILIDTSKSTRFGNPDKLRYMQQVAAALAYVGLVNHNRVSLAAVSNRMIAETGGMRGRRRVGQMLDFISNLEPDAGPTDLGAAMKRFALTAQGRGVCVMLSDFFDKSGIENALRYVAGRRFDFYALHILSPQEIDPDLKGDLRLVDIEDQDTAELTITQPLLDRYKANLNAWCLSVKQYVTRRGGAYLFTSTNVPFDQLVLGYLRQRGLLG